MRVAVLFVRYISLLAMEALGDGKLLVCTGSARRVGRRVNGLCAACRHEGGCGDAVAVAVVVYCGPSALEPAVGFGGAGAFACIRCVAFSDRIFRKRKRREPQNHCQRAVRACGRVVIV